MAAPSPLRGLSVAFLAGVLLPLLLRQQPSSHHFLSVIQRARSEYPNYMCEPVAAAIASCPPCMPIVGGDPASPPRPLHCEEVQGRLVKEIADLTASLENDRKKLADLKRSNISTGVCPFSDGLPSWPCPMTKSGHLLTCPSTCIEGPGQKSLMAIPQLSKPFRAPSLSASSQRIIYGCGTGRCGTSSLAVILNRQAEAEVHHEALIFPWSIPETEHRAHVVKDRIKRLREMSSPSAKWIGDVQSSVLPNIPEILRQEPGTKFVCLYRPRHEVVDSFLRKTASVNQKSGLELNHWVVHDGLGPWREYEHYDSMFPKFSCVTNKTEAVEQYWDLYYDILNEYMNIYPESIRLYATEDVGSNLQTQKAMLEWLGFSNPVVDSVCENGPGCALQPEAIATRRLTWLSVLAVLAVLLLVIAFVSWKRFGWWKGSLPKRR